MTLRDLLNDATRRTSASVTPRSREEITADVLLHDLAPEMAALLVDMADEWQRLIDYFGGVATWTTVEALLARYRELEARTEQT